MNELCRECGRWVPEEEIAAEYDGVCICGDCWNTPPDPIIKEIEDLRIQKKMLQAKLEEAAEGEREEVLAQLMIVKCDIADLETEGYRAGNTHRH